MIRPFNPASPTISARSGKEIQASRNWKNSFCSTINSEISPAFNEAIFLQKDFQPLISPLFLLNINSYSLLENGAIVCKNRIFAFLNKVFYLILLQKCYNNLKGQKWSSGFIDRIYSCYLVLGWFEEKWSVY